MTPPNAPDAGLRDDEREWGRLADAAIRGPWVVKPGRLLDPTVRIEEWDDGYELELFESGGVITYQQPNCAFVAAARTAVPELLARLQALRAENQRLREELGRWKEAAALQYGAGFEEARTRVWSGASMLRVNIQRGYYKDRTAEQPIIDLQTRIEEMEAPRPAAGEEKEGE